MPSFISYTTSTSTIDFSVSSTSYSDVGTYEILITHSGTDGYGVTQTGTNTLKVIVPDPCLSTSFVSQTLSNAEVLVSASGALTYAVPILDDSANAAVSGSPSSSICGSQTLSILESPTYMTSSVSGAVTTLSFTTTDSADVGSHTLNL